MVTVADMARKRTRRAEEQCEENAWEWKQALRDGRERALRREMAKRPMRPILLRSASDGGGKEVAETDWPPELSVRVAAEVVRDGTDLREESRAQDSAARAQRRRSERIRTLERLRDTEAHADRRLDHQLRVPERIRDMEARANRRTIPEYRNPERVRDAAAPRAIRREDSEERRQEQVQNTADHASRRTNPEFRIQERIRDAEARATHREDPEERAREQERNTGEHRQRRRDPENRQRERERDADYRRGTRRNPIARTQEQRINTSQRRETRQQRRIREQQIRLMAEERLINFRMDPQNRLDASQRQSQRNMDARAQLSEDELDQEREQQRNRIRATARDLYHRNIKEGPTEICICCGGTWFRSQPLEFFNVEDPNMLLLTESNSQLFLLRLLPSTKAKEQHIAKSPCILKEASSELRYMLVAAGLLAHQDFSF
ncbi:trichohyalin-like [Drosophila bipectinata]|uniref:trichohyalin-like n=1 Tax=Drosophila bipectinata TaxID=42026 RepID=UPI0038B2F979